MSTTTEDPAAVRELARSLGCITEPELCALAEVLPSTAEAWRKRGTGPEHIVFGRAILYPRAALAEFLKTKVRTPRGRIAARDVL